MVIMFTGINLVNCWCVSSGQSVLQPPVCLFNDWATFTGWTSEQCFHVLKIPAAPAPPPPSQVGITLHRTQPEQTCTKDEPFRVFPQSKLQPERAQLDLFQVKRPQTCSLDIKLGFRNRVFDVEYCPKSIKTSKILFSESICSGFWWRPARLWTSLSCNFIAHRAGGSGNLTTPSVPPNQNHVPVPPPSPLPTPCKLEVDVFLWDSSLTDAVPNLLIRAGLSLGLMLIGSLALL